MEQFLNKGSPLQGESPSATLLNLLLSWSTSYTYSLQDVAQTKKLIDWGGFGGLLSFLNFKTSCW